MSTQPKTFVTPEEYLDLERKAEFKSEYHDGKIFAMSGGSTRHDDIVAQLSGLVHQHLRGNKKCSGLVEVETKYGQDQEVIAVHHKILKVEEIKHKV